MRFLGLDVGDRRIGVAFGDADVRIATPVEVIVRGNFEQDVLRLGECVRRYAAEHLIVGLPRNMDGTHGDQANGVIAYAERVAPALNLPVTFWDERLSTVEATSRIQATGARGKKSRRKLDAIAATVILQDYLDSTFVRNEAREARE